MAKVIYKSLKPERGSASSVREKEVIGPDGQKAMVLTVDASSPRFGEDLRIVFAENVKKANTEYKRVLGAKDRARKK